MFFVNMPWYVINLPWCCWHWVDIDLVWHITTYLQGWLSVNNMLIYFSVAVCCMIRPRRPVSTEKTVTSSPAILCRFSKLSWIYCFVLLSSSQITNWGHMTCIFVCIVLCQCTTLKTLYAQSNIKSYHLGFYLIKSPRYTGDDFMFLYQFVRRLWRRLRRRRQRLVHVIISEQLFRFLSFLVGLVDLHCRLPD